MDGFFRGLQDYALVDALLASAESRRAAALREIERWRDSFASRLRKASDEVIDGEIIDNFPGPAGPASSKARGKMIPKNAPRRDGAVAVLPPSKAKKNPSSPSATALRRTSP
jgi:hypothetical protein